MHVPGKVSCEPFKLMLSFVLQEMNMMCVPFAWMSMRMVTSSESFHALMVSSCIFRLVFVLNQLSKTRCLKVNVFIDWLTNFFANSTSVYTNWEECKLFSLFKSKTGWDSHSAFSLNIRVKENLGLMLSPNCLYLVGKHIPELLVTLKTGFHSLQNSYTIKHYSATSDTEMERKGDSPFCSSKPCRPLPWLHLKSLLSVHRSAEYFRWDRLFRPHSFSQTQPAAEWYLVVTYLSVHKTRLLLTARKCKKPFKSLYLEIWKRLWPKSIPKLWLSFIKAAQNISKVGVILPSLRLSLYLLVC